jgi:hypothetical protein
VGLTNYMSYTWEKGLFLAVRLVGLGFDHLQKCAPPVRCWKDGKGLIVAKILSIAAQDNDHM